MTPDDEVNGVKWLQKNGVPNDWITLFGKAFESATFNQADVAFNTFYGSEDILDFIKQQGFYDRIDEYLHQTVCIDMDMDCFLVEWHLSFPGNEERVAWLLVTDHEKQLQGWY